MNATAESNHYQFTDDDRKRGHTLTVADTLQSALIRTNPIAKLRAAQEVLHKIITGAVKWYDGEQVIDVPAREIASCSVALCKVEERIRLNQGKANPAPIKSEGKAKSRSRSGLVPPAPRVAEPEPIAKPTEPALLPTDPATGKSVQG